MPDLVTMPDLQAALSNGGLDISDRQLRRLAGDGHLPPPVKGEWKLVPTLVALAKYYHTLRADKESLAAARLRKTVEEADRLSLENEKTRGGLISAEETYKAFEGLFVALRARILASSLTDVEKDELLNDLRGLKDNELGQAHTATNPPTPVDTQAAAEI